MVWITCGLLWCFYQLFGLSFWRHPFTAEDPLVSKWWKWLIQHVRNGRASFPWMLLTSTNWPIRLVIINGRMPATKTSSALTFFLPINHRHVPRCVSAAVYLWPALWARSSWRPWRFCPSPERDSAPVLWPSCCCCISARPHSRNTLQSLWSHPKCSPYRWSPAAPAWVWKSETGSIDSRKPDATYFYNYFGGQ